jgi:hypothetical protein
MSDKQSKSTRFCILRKIKVGGGGSQEEKRVYLHYLFVHKREIIDIDELVISSDLILIKYQEFNITPTAYIYIIIKQHVLS